MHNAALLMGEQQAEVDPNPPLANGWYLAIRLVAVLQHSIAVTLRGRAIEGAASIWL